jgi:hypothetical protein
MATNSILPRAGLRACRLLLLQQQLILEQKQLLLLISISSQVYSSNLME